MATDQSAKCEEIVRVLETRLAIGARLECAMIEWCSIHGINGGADDSTRHDHPRSGCNHAARVDVDQRATYLDSKERKLNKIIAQLTRELAVLDAHIDRAVESQSMLEIA